MKSLRLFFILLFIAARVSGQSTFKLRGEVAHPDGSNLIVTVYRNWVEDPQDFTLTLDDRNKFAFEIILDEIGYVDIHYGDVGLYSWIIEPNDDIYLKFDRSNFDKTFMPVGKGSQKWVYLLEQKRVFEDEKDWDLEVQKLNKISKKGFYELSNFLLNEQMNLLNKYKASVSDEFYTLKRADIIGKINLYNLEFLVSNNLFGKQQQANDFDLRILNPRLQNKSQDYGLFIEAYLENYAEAKNYNPKTHHQEFVLIKSFFLDLDLVDKSVVERILASKVVSYLDLEGYNDENELIVGAFQEFCKNKVYNNYVVSKFNKLKALKPGNDAQPFALSDGDGKTVELKDFKGKNVFLSFYASWCGPCLNDMSFLPIVNNYFKDQKDLVFLSVSVDTPQDFNDFVKNQQITGINVNIGNNTKVVADYAAESVPRYYLIDKSGKIIAESIIEPSADEGRALIKQIERILYLK